MSGGGTNYRKKAKLAVCFHKIILFFNGLDQLDHKSGGFRAPNFGGILIEFAFSIPVLIILMFFVLDHYRWYELKSKVKTSTYLMASMIQNVTNNRTNKTLLKNDFARIAFVSCMNFSNPLTFCNPWSMGIYYATNFWWVKRLSENSYRTQKCGATTGSNGTSPFQMNYFVNNESTHDKSWVETLHPDLVCTADGDERLMLESCYRNKNYRKDKLGFYFMNPTTSRVSSDGMTNNIVFQQIVITPKPGLFPATN